MSSCIRALSSLTPAIGTTAAARDMNILRRLLGEEKLNFLGISYGSLLGSCTRQFQLSSRSFCVGWCY